MSLEVLTDAGDIGRAYEALRQRLVGGAQEFPRKLGWQGGGDEHTLRWHAEERLWVVLADKYIDSRYWCCYGTEDPNDGDNFGITCEINPPKKGIDRRCAGLFVRDDRGEIYLAHSGKLGGGRKGVGKDAFLSFYGADGVEQVAWPDGETSQAIIIGRLDSERLIAHVSRFVREVERFKNLGSSGGTVADGEDGADLTFAPEFEGARQPYTIDDPIESRCSHGLVVNSLAMELEARGCRPASDSRRDIFFRGKRGQPGVLFEAKTDLSTTSIYALIGQLLFHGTCRSTRPKLVAVLPGRPNGETGKVFAHLGITVLSYNWSGTVPQFEGLDEVLCRVDLA